MNIRISLLGALLLVGYPIVSADVAVVETCGSGLDASQACEVDNTESNTTSDEFVPLVVALPPENSPTNDDVEAFADETAAELLRKKTVAELLASPTEAIFGVLGGLYELSPWVAEKFLVQEDEASRTGIATVTELARRLRSIVDESSYEQKLALLRVYPDLCEKAEILMKQFSKDSQEEQSKAGLQSLSAEELKHFRTMIDAYKEKFGFPFILAVRNASKDTVLRALEGRLAHSSPQQEFDTALAQVHNIAWMRLLTKVDTDGAAGFLTCHVLDTANGIPAEKMKVVLTRLTPEESVLGEFVTNDDGRLEGGPALHGAEFTVGTYQWDFYAADYFASRGQTLNGTPFLDIIPIRFGIDNPDDHYHVPLLVSPWGFSTYRGS